MEKFGSAEGSSSEPDTSKYRRVTGEVTGAGLSMQKKEITPQLNKRLEKGDTW